VVSAKGADLTMLVSSTKSHIVELQAQLKQIIAHHPTGGDASNAAALGAVLAQLA
jgi:hypothetical protein